MLTGVARSVTAPSSDIRSTLCSFKDTMLGLESCDINAAMAPTNTITNMNTKTIVTHKPASTAKKFSKKRFNIIR